MVWARVDRCLCRSPRSLCITQRMFEWTIKAPRTSEPEGSSPNPGSGCRRPRASRHSTPRCAGSRTGSRPSGLQRGCALCRLHCIHEVRGRRPTPTASCWAAAWSTAAPVHPQGLREPGFRGPGAKFPAHPAPSDPTSWDTEINGVETGGKK